MLSTHWFCLMRFISWDTLIKMQNNPLWKGLTFPQRPRWGQFSSDSCQPLHFPGNLFMPPLPCFSLKFSALAHCSSCSSGSHKGKTKKQFLSQPLFFKKIDQPPGLHLPIMVCCRLKRRMFGHPAKKKKIKRGMFQLVSFLPPLWVEGVGEQWSGSEHWLSSQSELNLFCTLFVSPCAPCFISLCLSPRG